MALRIAGIDRLDVTNNPGSDRPSITIWFAGCSMACPECQNPKLHDKNSGKEYSIVDVYDIIMTQESKCEEPYDIVLLGGEPLEQDHMDLSVLCSILHKADHRIWMYTGHEIDEIPSIVIKHLHWVKTGRYMEELKTGGFPASSNQHIYMNGGSQFTLIQ